MDAWPGTRSGGYRVIRFRARMELGQLSRQIVPSYRASLRSNLLLCDKMPTAIESRFPTEKRIVPSEY